jgi:hypothetical protein
MRNVKYVTGIVLLGIRKRAPCLCVCISLLEKRSSVFKWSVFREELDLSVYCLQKVIDMFQIWLLHDAHVYTP